MIWMWEEFRDVLDVFEERKGDNLVCLIVLTMEKANCVLWRGRRVSPPWKLKMCLFCFTCPLSPLRDRC